MTAALLPLLTEGPERGGWILRDGTIVEVANASPTPNDGFAMSVDDAIAHCDEAAATFHTHPGQTANLSKEDWETFIQWPGHTHIIVGTDGVRYYNVKGAAVVNA